MSAKGTLIGEEPLAPPRPQGAARRMAGAGLATSGGRGAPPVHTDSAIGEAIQKLREERGLSLRTFAATTGFSPSFLSQVENSQASPSIASLERLARALGLGLADFFGRVSAESALVMRGKERRRFTSAWSRARIEPLVPRSALRHLDGVLITLEPGGRSGKDASVQPYEQLALVLDGEIVLSLGQATHVLVKGDAAAIPSHSPHAWENRGASTSARIALVTERGGEEMLPMPERPRLESQKEDRNPGKHPERRRAGRTAPVP